MGVLLRVFACVGLAGLLLAGLGSLDWAWQEGTACDWSDLGEVLTQLQDTWEQRQRLDAQAREYNELIQAKSAIAWDVIEGRCGLLEAAACMKEVCDRHPEFWQRAREQEPGRTEQERLCWHVIGWVRGVLDDQPARTATVGERLEAELRRQ